MKTIAVFIDSYNIDYSPSILNLLDFLSDNCRIDLFMRNVQMKNSAVLGKKNIHLVQIKQLLSWRKTLICIKQRLANGIKGHWRSAFLPARSPRAVARRFAGSNHHCHIAFDPHGMLLCKELFPLARPFYYSLEIYMLAEVASSNKDLSILPQVEKSTNMSAAIKGLIIQSPEREQLFRTDHQLTENTPVLYLPVTGTGPAVDERQNLLRERYRIPSPTRIAVHLGGVEPIYSSLEIAETFTKIPGWCIFFQGNHLRKYSDKIRIMAKSKGTCNIIVLKKFFTEINSMQRILMSCDVGIAWYNNISFNFRSAGQSSGKIAAYLKFGLPIVANRYPSTEEALEKPGCGICVDDWSEIPAALEKISHNYAFFSSNARREYERHYRFNNYHSQILRFFQLLQFSPQQETDFQ